ncbi:MAG: bifunctional hydroxymethylpyrimidine kinase/phosphomethylpyrimidine kinase [Desulfobacterota bacterium]|nr:bifunctional hydroxymethylpyrimidine kinase/phosphomethylpyrimidine kinase [Thermodesulfobacteriota bacterium]
MRRILIIAASDSGGGAGIQADIKAVTLYGCHAMTAITALTVQNTIGVENVLPVAASFVEDQIRAVLSDIGADAVKTGMLLNTGIIRAVVQMLTRFPVPRVIVDPVMKAKSGHSLLDPAAVQCLKRELFPCAFMVTPNLDEAAELCGFAVDSDDALREAARMIHALGPRYVLLKGGHRRGDCCDVLYDGSVFTEFDGERIDTKNTHGTGCTLASAIAAGLAQGMDPCTAVRRAKEFVTTAIRCAASLGAGHGPTNPFANVQRDAQIMACVRELEAAYAQLEQARIGTLIPEVQSNFGYALAGAQTPDDVVAFPGRIVRLRDTIARVAAPEPGASRHIAKVILTAHAADPSIRSAMNIAFSDALLRRCRDRGLRIAEFSRTDEPSDVQHIEGSTLEWGTRQAIDAFGGVPDIIADRGGMGKEPMIRVLGTDPNDVARKVIRIHERQHRAQDRC